MRTLSSVLIFLLVLQHLTAQKALTITPDKPRPGETISILYNPAGTELFGLSELEAVAYLMEGAAPIAREILLTKKGNFFSASIQTNDTTQAVFLTFFRDGRKDNNRDEGYFTMLYTKEGTPVPGARLSVGRVLTSQGTIWGLKRNPEGSKLIREEFTSNPSLKEKYQTEYLRALGQPKEEAYKDELKRELTALLNKPGVQEGDFNTAVLQYEHVLKDKQKAEELTKAMKEKFPDGSWKRNEQVSALYKEKDPEKKELLYREIMEKFPAKNEQDSNVDGTLAYSLVSSFGNAGNYDKMKEYAVKVRNKSSLAGVYNNIAWKMAGSGITGKPGNVEIGKDLSWQSLEIMKDEMNDIKGRPTFYTEKQWKDQQESTYYMYADTYALLLYHLKEYNKAYEYQKRGIEHSKRRDVGMNESYAVYLEKVKGPKAAQRELELFIRDGKFSNSMKDQLKRIYMAQKNTEAEWTAYIAVLEKASFEKKKEEIGKKMISEPAPAFTIKDMAGADISLASLKGKVVVVDFWATWCGPCIASFPGMKKAIEKYKEDPDVKFVFIDTWENGENEKIQKQVGDFIQKNAYPFHVLMDYDNKVVEKYGVDGIPAKFVIDKNNNIRFRSVGYGGTADGLADELTLMIEMARTGGSAAIGKKAF